MRHAVVEPEQVRLVVIAVGNDHGDVVEHRRQLVGKVVEGVGDEPLEAVPRNDVHELVGSLARSSLGSPGQLTRSAELNTFFGRISTAIRSASSWKARPVSLSGSTAAIGLPSSPPARSAGTSGSWASSGTSSSAA